jgi:hypothetical protein
VTDLLELAERCEAAEGHPGNHSFRELDLDILLAVQPDHEARLMPRAGKPNPQSGTTWEWTSGGVAWTRGTSFASLPIPHYTRSLDAAMTLVPDGGQWRWRAGQYNVDPLKCRADLAETGEIFTEDKSLGISIKTRAQGCAATPALALCAAALRARDALLAEREKSEGRGM